MKEIWILDDSLGIKIFFDKQDCAFEDNICVEFYESCLEEEKIFISDETHIYLTPEQALKIANALLQAIGSSYQRT